MDIEQFLSLVEQKSPPAPAEALTAFEAEIGDSLPDDYRRFLIQSNGGGSRLWFQGTNAAGQPVEAGVNCIGGFRTEEHFSLAEYRKCYKGRIPRALLCIMIDPFGNTICLGVSDKYRAKVYFWDHENEPLEDEWDGRAETAGNVELLANSFAEFVAGLGPNPWNADDE